MPIAPEIVPLVSRSQPKSCNQNHLNSFSWLLDRYHEFQSVVASPFKSSVKDKHKLTRPPSQSKGMRRLEPFTLILHAPKIERYISSSVIALLRPDKPLELVFVKSAKTSNAGKLLAMPCGAGKFKDTFSSPCVEDSQVFAAWAFADSVMWDRYSVSEHEVPDTWRRPQASILEPRQHILNFPSSLRCFKSSWPQN